jgi:hypothetical protein
MSSTAPADGPTRFSWAPQLGPQKALIDCPYPEILFGGARGGGKTDGILGKYAIKEKRWGRGFNAVFFRKEMPQQDDLIERAKEIYGPTGAKWHEQKKQFSMPHGGRLRFRPLESVVDAEKYQGQSLSDAAVEEAGNYPMPAPIDRLFGCLRSSVGVPVQLVLSANPGGPGHQWIKHRYIDPGPAGFKRLVRELPDNAEHHAVYIPSRISDNRIMLAKDPGYVNRLHLVGSPNLVRAWLKGDWNIVAGGALDDVWTERVIVPRFPLPYSWRLDRSHDWGSSHPFSVLWWGQADGTEAKFPDGRVFCPPKGSLILAHEWYGASEPNKGIKMSPRDVAKGIKARESDLIASKWFASNPRPGPADNEISAVKMPGTPTIADEMLKEGVAWTKSDKAPGTRKIGLELMRSRIREAGKEHPEDAALYVMQHCSAALSHWPVLPRDPQDQDDVQTNAEDHDYDAARYRILAAKPMARSINLSFAN